MRSHDPGVELVERADDRTRPTTAGAGVVTAAGDAWFLADGEPAHALGAALVWLARADPTHRQHVIVEPAGVGTAALRLAPFAVRPELCVTGPGDRLAGVTVPTIDDAVGMVAPARPFQKDRYLATLPPGARRWVATLLAAVGSLDAVAVEHEDGVCTLTVRGLEVARVEVEDDVARLDVGVGHHDRAARRELTAGRDATDLATAMGDLVGAVQTVLDHRRADAPFHQVAHLREERWLRACVCADPTLAGLAPATRLDPAPPPVAVDNLVERAVAPAVGDGHVVVCQTGVDPDLVPSAAHAWLRTLAAAGAHARLTIVVPRRDDHPVNRLLLGRLDGRLSARLVTVNDDWAR